MDHTEEAVNLMGPDCSSWGMPNRGTSRRNYMNVWGAMHLDHVTAGNMTISRTEWQVSLFGALMGYLCLPANHQQ